MALNLITNPPTVPTISPDHWTQFVVRSNANMKGVDFSTSTFCLTNWNTGTSKPEICQGSIFEVGGSFYEADSDTALTDDGGIIDGQVHIKLVPNVGGTQVIPTLTSDAIPAWDSTKYGWYDGDEKFLPVEMTRSGAITKVYSSKFEYTNQNKINKLFADGGQYIGGNTEVDGALTVSGGGSFGGAVSTPDGVSSGSSSFGLKWKRLTGNTSSSSQVTNIIHGISGTIISASGNVMGSGTDRFIIGADDPFSSFDFSMRVLTTYIMIENTKGNTAFYSSPYDIVVFYI